MVSLFHNWPNDWLFTLVAASDKHAAGKTRTRPQRLNLRKNEIP